MNIESQLIFFLSALGAFNGFLLSFYFAKTAERKKFSNYFLALLLLVLSIRITKSVFYYYNPKLATVFIQIGLSACSLIGPFLFLYLKAYTTKQAVNWKIHTISYLAIITIIGFWYSYLNYQGGWNIWIVRSIYFQWFLYIIFSFKFLKPTFKKLSDKKQLRSIDVWLLSIYLGVVIIWLAYNIATYTSYIVGALSFSFVLYLIILLFIFKNDKQTMFFEEKEKYKNKNIAQNLEEDIKETLVILQEKELFLDPNISLQKTADELGFTKHTLSQYFNEKLNKSFSTYINELRVEKAKTLLQSESNYTIEAIGYESGFNSKSTFFAAFKKITKQTPSSYRRSKAF